jgi:hypothetical protein
MKSFIRNSLTSKPASRNKRLALTLLVSFCLTYIGQAFAMPMMCMMPASDEVDSSISSVSVAKFTDAEFKGLSPCHQMMSETSTAADATPDNVGIMDCCDQVDSDSGVAISTHDCACSDGGCSASITFFSSFSYSSLNVSEQPYYYSTIGFPSQIDSALFRPPIA